MGNEVVWLDNNDSGETVLVIEHSAYMELKERNEVLQKLADSQIAYATRLEGELKAARTLDALLGDNGQVCELHDEMDKLKAEAEKLAEALKVFDAIHFTDSGASCAFGSDIAYTALTNWQRYLSEGK